MIFSEASLEIHISPYPGDTTRQQGTFRGNMIHYVRLIISANAEEHWHLSSVSLISPRKDNFQHNLSFSTREKEKKETARKAKERKKRKELEKRDWVWKAEARRRGDTPITYKRYPTRCTPPLCRSAGPNDSSSFVAWWSSTPSYDSSRTFDPPPRDRSCHTRFPERLSFNWVNRRLIALSKKLHQWHHSLETTSRPRDTLW